MEHQDEVSKIPVFPTKPGSLFSYSDRRSVASVPPQDRHGHGHKQSATFFNADGVSISDVGLPRPPTATGTGGGRFRSRPTSRRRSRIMDRGRNEYASYFTHATRPSKGSSRRWNFLDRGGVDGYGEQASIRENLASVYEPPHFEVERRIQEGESISPRTSPDGLYVPEKVQTRNGRLGTIFMHVLLGLLFTGWWIASLVLHRKDMNWIIPLILWMAVMVRLITLHVYSAWLMSPIYFIWDEVSGFVLSFIPRRLQHLLGGILVACAVVVVTMINSDFEDNTRVNRGISLLGYGFCIVLLWATSRNRRAIDWYTVIVGIMMQFVIALLVLRTSTAYDILSWISQMCRQLLENANLGLAFLTDATVPTLSWLVISFVPPIIFFAGLAQILSYWGVLAWLVRKLGGFFWWAMRISGVEAVVASTSPFLGMGEAVMLIRPFLPHITNAELHQIMCSGFATIAGSVLVAYINLGIDGEVLISSCVMSIPISLVVSKLRYPEEEEPFAAQYVVVPEVSRSDGVNFLHAFTNGVWLGFKIAGIVVAALSSVIALIALIDALLTWWAEYINIGPSTPFTLELILSYLLYPIAFLLGVPRNGDLLKVSRLIGMKILKNEFAAYRAMQTDAIYTTLSGRSRLIAAYSLCGFGNLGALGTQIGLLSQMAPERSGDISRVAWSAWITGIISTLMSASMAGMLITDQRALFSSPVGGLNNTLAGNSTLLNSLMIG